MNKKHLFWIIPLCLTTFVASAWLFSISGGFTMIVNSLPGYATIELDMPLIEVNTTMGSSINSANTSILLNKDMDLLVEITETYQDNSGGLCIGGLNDCVTIYYLENSGNHLVLSSGSNISINSNPIPRELKAELSCVAYSCPQSRSAEITLTEIK